MIGFEMGFFSTISWFFGFGVGISIGLVAGYFLFIFFQPTDVEDPIIKPLVEQDLETLQRMLPEIPLWIRSPDFDRLDWLNKFLEYMWPYLDKAICKAAKNILAKSIAAEQTPKYKFDSVEFETLTLGSLAPTFHGIKVHMTDEKELIMEPCVKWAGNPNVTVAAKALFGLLKATVQVVDLQVFLLPRITLKPLVPSFPCFANIHVSLIEKPHVDFGLKLLGADLMSIPGAYMIVQDLIKDQVANMYLWPKTLKVRVLDPAKALRIPVGILHVKVVQAILELKEKCFLSAPNPYVKLNLTDQYKFPKKTTVKHKNANPEWNEAFNFVVKDPESQVLEINVYDWEQFRKHGKMGMNVVPLKQVSPEETNKRFTLDLLNTLDPNDVRNEKLSSRGQIVVELTYKPFKVEEEEEELGVGIDETPTTPKAPEGTPAGGGLFVIIVHEAQDVEGKCHTNPHVHLIFRGEKKKTRRVKKNRDPTWDEEFKFMVEEPPTSDRLHVEVVSTSSRNLFHRKESLGYVEINLGDVVASKRINDKYNLIGSKKGRIHIELLWRTP